MSNNSNFGFDYTDYSYGEEMPCGCTKRIGPHVHCPECGSAPSRHIMKNYSLMWHEGDVYCKDCHAYVRGYDAG